METTQNELDQKEIKQATKPFFDGQSLSAIYVDKESMFRVGESMDEAKSITVGMESGQMGYVPWAIIILNSGEILKFNMALMYGVKTKKG